MKVIKRNGKVVDFDESKIELAILNAMYDINYKDKDNIHDIVESIVEQLEEELEELIQEEITVEEIQEIVIAELYSLDKKLGKVYNDYRNNHTLNRQNKTTYKILTGEFLSKYKHLPDPFPTDMSAFVFYRTYSRFLPKENRRERWWEVVARVVEYNCSLAPTSKEEAEQLFDNIFNLRQFPAGRSLWTANTEVSKKYPMSNFNCSFGVVNNFDKFVDAFYLLLIGAGVGFRILPEDVIKLPKVRTDIEIINQYFKPVSKNERKELTEYTFLSKDMIKIIIGDSKEAWVQALNIFLRIHYESFYKNIKTIVLDYNNIRQKGEQLKTFGGYASGHESMETMLNKISNIIKKASNKIDDSYVKLKPIDCSDIANILGENVVSGGVRRTSEVVLFDEKDTEMIQAKNNLYKQIDGKWTVDQNLIHRQMSNNSIFYTKKPTREQLHWQVENMRFTGEPAFLNQENAKKRRENFQGGNPCMEILLDDNGMCNLTEIVPLRFIDENGTLDEKKLYEAQRLSARMGYRMTCVDFELHNWDYINKRDRLIGCSITGWEDFVNILDLSKEEQIRILSKLKQIAIDESNKLADELKLNRPILNTCVKPSGTISLLPNVSAGVHHSHSEYYIRRIRINAFDPLALALKDMGYNLIPEVGSTKENCKTVVVEFPMQAPKGKTKFDVTAIEQLENYKMFMKYYANHNVSITVTVRENEWEQVEDWLWNNWDDIVAISFLALDDAIYQLMPFEEITEERYGDMCKITPKFNPSFISKYEKGEEFEIIDSECESGICPIK